MEGSTKPVKVATNQEKPLSSMEHVYVKLVSSQRIPARTTVVLKGHI